MNVRFACSVPQATLDSLRGSGEHGASCVAAAVDNDSGKFTSSTTSQNSY